MRIVVLHGIDDLADDLRKIPAQARKDMVGVVKEGIRTGGMLARDNARQTSGTHGKHYPRSITWEMSGTVSFGGVNGIAGEYGPDSAKPQGGMSFEGGSINQPPHNDLAKSADVIAPAFMHEVRRLPGRWFW